jgi:hypothetical protein
MKKLWILLVAIAMLGAVPLFADVTLSGELMGAGWWNFSDPGGTVFPKVELNGVANIDDFNTLKFEFDVEGVGDLADTGFGGGSWSGWDSTDPTDFVDKNGDPVTVAARSVALDDIRLITDWGKALMLPVGITTTVGYFDTYFTGWYYYDASGWAWYYPWDNKVVEQGPKASGAMQVDIAAGPVNIHWYNDGAGNNFMVGADAAFAGLSAYLAYGSTFGAFGDGDLSVELAYAIMDIANVGAFFRYGLGDSAYTYGLNVGAGFGMFHVAAGLEGDDVDALDNIIAEVTVAPADPAKIWVAAFMDLGGAESFAGLDVGASYKVGAAEFALGYLYRPAAAAAVPSFFKGDQFAPDGLYAGAYIAY